MDSIQDAAATAAEALSRGIEAETINALRVESASLRTENASLRAENEGLRAKVGQLEVDLADAEEAFADLERRYREVIDVNSEQLARLRDAGLREGRDSAEIAKLRKEVTELMARMPPMSKALAKEATKPLPKPIELRLTRKPKKDDGEGGGEGGEGGAK